MNGVRVSGQRGQGRQNGNALRHGGKSLLALVRRATDDGHPVMRIIRDKADAYELDQGGPDALGTAQRDSLEHGATLALLCRMHVHKILNSDGRPRRMSATEYRAHCLAFARLAEAYTRVMSSVGLARKPKDVPNLNEYLTRQYGHTCGDDAEDPEGDATQT